MRYILSLTLAVLIANTSSAQVHFNYAPSLGHNMAWYKMYTGNPKTANKTEVLAGPSLAFRFIADYKHVQIGVGISYHSVSRNGFGALGSGSSAANDFFHQQLLFNYKFVNWDRSYLYAGLCLGTSADRSSTRGDQYILRPMAGGQAGWVIKLGGIVDMEVSESFIYAINGYRYSLKSPFSGTELNANMSLQMLTTNIGIRLHSRR